MKKVIQRKSPMRIYRCFINDHFVHWAVEEPLRPFGCILRHQGGFWQQGRQVERYEGDFSLGKFCYFYQTISDLWLCFWIATRGGQQLTSCSHHLQGALINSVFFSPQKMELLWLWCQEHWHHFSCPAKGCRCQCNPLWSCLHHWGIQVEVLGGRRRQGWRGGSDGTSWYPWQKN